MTDSGVDDNVFDSEVEENLFAEGDAKVSFYRINFVIDR